MYVCNRCVFACACDVFWCVMVYVQIVCIRVCYVCLGRTRRVCEQVCVCLSVHAQVCEAGVWRSMEHGGETGPPLSQDEQLADLSETCKTLQRM